MQSMSGFLSNATVAIIGLGLMGGSLAMALKGKCARIIGFDSDQDVLQAALEKKVIDAGYLNFDEIPSAVEVIVLAVPVNAILSLLEDLQTFSYGNAIVLDLGSTKVKVIEAMEKLPLWFTPIGGHPMCGKEISGFSHADDQIFRGATFAFTPLKRTNPRACLFAIELAESIGAKAVWIDAETHDLWVAFTSHLPYVLSNTLSALTPLEAALLTGPGYRSFTRLASSPVHVMMDILQTNRENILEGIHHLQERLSCIASFLTTENYHELSNQLSIGKETYHTIQRCFIKGEPL